MIDVLPAILAHDEEDFRSMILYPSLRQCTSTVHVDILDGSMFNAYAWAEPEIVGNWRGLPDIELHIMTERPHEHLERWMNSVPSVIRAIIHAEISSPLHQELEYIRQHAIQTGLAISPATPIDSILEHAGILDRLLVMGIQPGRSGQPFLGETILAKLRRARQLLPHVLIAVDGGVKQENAPSLVHAGASSLVASSAIWRQANPISACAQLVHSF